MESPGTAPGSDPLITSAFMSIVPKDNLNISGRLLLCNQLEPEARHFWEKHKIAHNFKNVRQLPVNVCEIALG